MKPTKKLIAVGVLSLLLLLLGLDNTCGIFTDDKCCLPVLMYHHFAPESDYYTIVSEDRFREQMTALKDAGFTAVTIDQIIRFVEEGTPLPDKPVWITMDDGYTSNLDVAAPILEEQGLCATVFVIGCWEGETVDAATGQVLSPPRFSYEAAAPWVEKGVLDLQSHSYGLHNSLEEGGERDAMLRREGESEEAYRNALVSDCAVFAAQREGRVASPLRALAYPHGFWSQETDRFLETQGIAITVTTDYRYNVLRHGAPETLRLMGRYTVEEDIDGDTLVSKLESVLGGFK